MRTILIFAAVSLSILIANGQRTGVPRPASQPNNSPETAIRRVLDSQVAAWNRGDIEGFMEGYARSADTTFIAGDTITRGWQTVLDRYKRGYNTREKMGTLQFSELEITPFASDTARALGRFTLTRPGEEKPFARGRFTLLFRRIPQGWRIIHDHTSAASSS
jgi:beta-aspartyl-peptidase (threonine type)